MTDDELPALLNEIVRQERQLGRPIAMPERHLAAIELAATRIEQLRKALDLMPDEIEIFRIMRAAHGNSHSVMAKAVAAKIESIRHAAIIQSGERNPDDEPAWRWYDEQMTYVRIQPGER